MTVCASERRPTAAVIIPALNEEEAIGPLVAELLDVAARPGLAVEIERVVVVDNGSTDSTAARARDAGAEVVTELRKGYGRACQTGVESSGNVELLIFLDGDRSDRADELPLVIAPVVAGEADLVIGSRVRGQAEPGSMSMPQIVGNWISIKLLALLYGVSTTDVGPFRAIRKADLVALGMTEMTYGWPVEMIARAGQSGLRVIDVPVSWRHRTGGVSKVSGDLKASIRAGGRIIATLLRTR